jgi:hypothetical protein
MGTLKAKISLTSTDISSDSIDFSVENSLTINNGGVIRNKVTANTSSEAQVLLAATSYSYPTYVYIKNVDTTATDYVHISLDPFSDSSVQLKGGEWAWFPWKGARDITVYTANTDDNTIVEYGVFYS